MLPTFLRGLLYKPFVRTFRKKYRPEIQLSRFQAQTIGGAIRTRAPGCNLLVFGLGFDSDLWINLNRDGETLFCETSEKWIAETRKLIPHVNVTLMPTFGLTVPSSQQMTREQLDAFAVPNALFEKRWDVILVDAPPGHVPTDPGRAVSIFWASQIATPSTHIFVDDYERPLERYYVDLLLKERRGTASYVITASDEIVTRRLFWSAGDPLYHHPRR